MELVLRLIFHITYQREKMNNIKTLKTNIEHLRILFVDDEEQIREMTGSF